MSMGEQYLPEDIPLVTNGSGKAAGARYVDTGVDAPTKGEGKA